jgi:hypothetical protein
MCQIWEWLFPPMPPLGERAQRWLQSELAKHCEQLMSFDDDTVGTIGPAETTSLTSDPFSATE